MAAAAASLATAARLIRAAPVPPSPFSSSLRLPLASLRGIVARPHLRHSPRFRATTSASSSRRDKLPDATLSYLDSAGEVQTVSVSDLTKGKRVVLFAKAGELRAKGVDTIVCVSVNDAFVMRAWKENLSIGDQVLLLSDGNLQLTRALGVELDLSDKPVGLGVRSRRYALLADDGVVTVLNLERAALSLSAASRTF
ncbi:unnamed protein product [Spirodela intermedia]|uniref:Glutaredoxin-dependent peroxiredoxin n=1 Tax=Spirodela intermedia TaxID=51605 RepID=A0A7I8IUT5_SPIIN|nr:unnamed protein product [Spirodela intermedia]CAA6660737.1 unnamed protein product [Spirodela intermedia]